MRAMNRIASVLFALSLVLAVGCEKKPPGEAGANEPGAGKATVADKAPDTEVKADQNEVKKDDSTAAEAASTAVVKLIEPGAEPRKELRYALKTGTKESIDLIMGMQMKMNIPGMPMPATKVPKMKMTMSVEITDKVGDKEAKYHFAVTDAGVLDTPGVDPMVATMTGTELKKVVGMKGTAIVDSRGFNRDSQLELPPGLNPQMKQMMEGTKQSMDQLSSPLPEEAVGVGAKWELIQTLTQNGITVKQKTLFELVSIDGDKGVLKAGVMQSADRQNAAMPNLPPGVKAELLSLNSTGDGEITFDLSGLLPHKAHTAIKTSSSFSMEQGGQKQQMSLDADLEMTLEKKK
jgi:hypothetical protein